MKVLINNLGYHTSLTISLKNKQCKLKCKGQRCIIQPFKFISHKLANSYKPYNLGQTPAGNLGQDETISHKDLLKKGMWSKGQTILKMNKIHNYLTRRRKSQRHTKLDKRKWEFRFRALFAFKLSSFMIFNKKNNFRFKRVSHLCRDIVQILKVQMDMGA